jgi:gamma-glutamyl phosphate reductase
LYSCRDEIADLLKLDDVIDLVIPRGGNALVSHIQVGPQIHMHYNSVFNRVTTLAVTAVIFSGF